ncbi:MAG: hypothetical protein R3C10_26760 [Pirellulales bacterium]
MKHHTTFIRTLICWLALLVLGGCAGTDKGGKLADEFAWLTGEPTPQDPGSIVVIWTDTVLNTVGQVPVRGFGGRVMFFDHPGGEQVAVSGNLTIYAYDESDEGAVTNIPDRKFVFTPEQLKKLYGKTDLGHSYSVWIPWDEVGGERKKISLLARFESDTGAISISEMSRHLLPGTAPVVDSSATVQQVGAPSGAGNNVQVSFDQANSTAPGVAESVVTRSERVPQRRRMTVDTIDVSTPLHQLLPPGASVAHPATGIDAGPSHSFAVNPAEAGFSGSSGAVFPMQQPLGDHPASVTSVASPYEAPVSSLPSVWELAQQRASGATAGAAAATSSSFRTSQTLGAIRTRRSASARD